MGAETATADLEFGGGASLKVDHGGPSSSSFNLDEFLKLANRVVNQGDEGSMAALNWCETPMVARGQERRVTGKFLKARHCLLPRIAGQTTVGNGGETSAKLQLPTAATVFNSSSEMGRNGGFSGRPMSASGRNPVTFPATGDVGGADVAAEVGHKVGEVDKRAADISPIRADVIHDARAEVIHNARADVIPAARADVIHDARADVIHPRADITNFMGEKYSNLGKKLTPVPLFIGNIPLHTGSNGIVNDKIADVFNNSSQKMLSLIAPTKQNGEVVVRPSLDIVRDGAKRWKSTAVGYFMVTATANGFFFFRFKTEIDMEEGQPIVLQKWEPGMAMRKLKHTQMPVWIKLRHLPLEFWTTEGLSTVASGVGKPLYPNAVTWVHETGLRSCMRCMTLGHSVKECSLTNPQKQTKPPVKVFVPKANVPTPPVAEEREKKHKTVVVVEDKVRGDEGTKQNKRYTSSQKEKGKEVVTFNPFDALNSLDDAEKNTRGPNTCSPSSSDPC
ncbi:UNVERIFIED_CONTAM: hypothetical protein Sindi_1278200 [Sesamum indicum]